MEKKEAWNKGVPLSQKHKEKLKLAWVERRKRGLGVAWNKGKTLSKEHASKCRVARLGKKHSEETKEKMRLAKLGKKNYLWKKNPSYRAIHLWIERQLGKAKDKKCVFCNKVAQHWANIDHLYERNTDDYIPLCVKCHKRFDK